MLYCESCCFFFQPWPYQVIQVILQSRSSLFSDLLPFHLLHVYLKSLRIWSFPISFKRVPGSPDYLGFASVPAVVVTALPPYLVATQ